MSTNTSIFANIKSDFPSSIVVFLVAMPLCLGIALASGAPLFAGIISGIIGGIVVGSFSGSAIGVTGPAAGLAVIVLTAIDGLGFNVFLVAVILAGMIQIIMGYLRAGIIGYYFPSSVIHGMLAGIGILIFLKQLPHAFGYDVSLEGEEAFLQADGHNTFSELFYMIDKVTPGALVITIISLAILILWESSFMKKFSFTKLIPGPLVAVISGILLTNFFKGNADFEISSEHLVSIPVPQNIGEFMGNFSFPDFAGLLNPAVYTTAIVIAIVASLETLLSLEAADKLDPLKRVSPANKELKAQGIGNILAGFLGGIPVTQVIVRSSANAQSGASSKLSAILHGVWLLLSIIFIPHLLNEIPLATLAAILLLIGYKLAKPALFRNLYNQGWGQFLPFIVTILAMLFTDLLRGIGLGMVVAVFVILRNNLKVPFTILKGSFMGTGSMKMILSEDVTFLNKAAIQNSLASIPNDTQVTIDGRGTHFVHHDVMEIFSNFEAGAEARNITVKRLGFDNINEEEVPSHFELKVENATTKEFQENLTPELALERLMEGNQRFVENKKLHRDYHTQIDQTSGGQFPFAAFLSCIDSRVPVEHVFDQGIGDVFSVRVAGNVINEDVLGSLEYACKVAGSKVIVVLGHSSCGAVNAACKDVELGHITPLLAKIKPAIINVKSRHSDDYELDADEVSRENAKVSMKQITEKSPILKEMVDKKEIVIVGANYDVNSGIVHFIE